MNRREALLKTTMAGAALATATSAFSRNHHAGHSSNASNPLATVASECIAAGEACLAHCAKLLSEGDKSMGDCNKSVLAMLGTCNAILRLSSLDNPHTRELARVCAKVCRDCMKACKPHRGHHAECKDCYEACKKCAEACEAY